MTAKKKPAKLRPDVAETAFRVMQEAIGEAPKTLPPSERTERNLEAARLGSLGGKKGGRARARSLSKAARSKIAKKGAVARWERREKGRP
jgi:hypothetical protein